MQAISDWRGPAIAAALTIALGLAACSDGGGPSSGTNLLTQVQASDLGAEVAHDMDDLADLSTFNPLTGVPMVSPMVAGPPGPPCVGVSPLPPANTDGDAVPDSVRFDFTGCVFTRWDGVVTDALSGTIDVIDPLPLEPSHGVRHVFTQFARTRTNSLDPLRNMSLVRNGTREWGGNADTLGHILSDFTTAWTHPGGRTALHTQDWVGKFTAAVPGTIAILDPLPAGSFTVNGTGSWTRMARSWSVATSTIVPLAYDPACTIAPRFTAGELHLVVTRDGEVTEVQVVFTGCGAYTVTRTPGSTT